MEQGSHELNLASRGRRLVAFMIDYILLCMISAISVFFLIGPGWDAGAFPSIGPFAGALGIGFFVFLARDFMKGQSPGKYIFGTSVRMADDRTKVPALWRRFVRNVPLMIFWPVELIAFLVSPEKRRTGDYLVGTCVVRLDKARWPRLAAAISIGVVGIVGMFLAMSMIMRQTAAYQTATQALANSEDVVGQVGRVQEFGPFPMGSVQVTNGHGRATLSISVSGEKGDADYQVAMRKQPGGEWQIIGIRKEP